MRNLQGKVAFVTGGSRGIAPPSSGGWRPTARTCLHLCQRIVVGRQGRQLVAEIQAGGGGALAIQADAADADQLRRAAERALDELGPVDVLVNNAGVFIAGDLAQPAWMTTSAPRPVQRARFVAVQALQPNPAQRRPYYNIGSCLADAPAAPA